MRLFFCLFSLLNFLDKLRATLGFFQSLQHVFLIVVGSAFKWAFVDVVLSCTFIIMTTISVTASRMSKSEG